MARVSKVRVRTSRRTRRNKLSSRRRGRRTSLSFSAVCSSQPATRTSTMMCSTRFITTASFTTADLLLTRTSRPPILQYSPLVLFASSQADTRLSLRAVPLEWIDTTVVRWDLDSLAASSIFMIHHLPSEVQVVMVLMNFPLSTYLKGKVPSYLET